MDIRTTHLNYRGKVIWLDVQHQQEDIVVQALQLTALHVVDVMVITVVEAIVLPTRLHLTLHLELAEVAVGQNAV